MANLKTQVCLVSNQTLLWSIGDYSLLLLILLPCDDKAKVGKRVVWHEIAFLAKNDVIVYQISQTRGGGTS